MACFTFCVKKLAFFFSLRTVAMMEKKKISKFRVNICRNFHASTSVYYVIMAGKNILDFFKFIFWNEITIIWGEWIAIIDDNHKSPSPSLAISVSLT